MFLVGFVLHVKFRIYQVFSGVHVKLDSIRVLEWFMSSLSSIRFLVGFVLHVKFRIYLVFSGVHVKFRFYQVFS
jgi:hypothetical protein